LFGCIERVKQLFRSGKLLLADMLEWIQFSWQRLC